jgi:hypothetical protein
VSFSDYSYRFRSILSYFARIYPFSIYRNLPVVIRLRFFLFTDSDRTKNYAGENDERFFPTITDRFHP